MAQDSLGIWKSTFEALPTDSTGATWAMNIANWVDSHVTSKLMLTNPYNGASTFPWMKMVFYAAITSLPPVPDTSGMVAIADAWKASISATTMTGMSGAYIGAATPATTFAAPPSVVINSGALSSAHSALKAGLIATTPVPQASASKFPELFHAAFAALAYDLSGISLPAPLVPVPISSPNTPVI